MNIFRKTIKNVNLLLFIFYHFRGNLALVRIYLSSLSYQVIKEEYAYSVNNYYKQVAHQIRLKSYIYS